MFQKIKLFFIALFCIWFQMSIFGQALPYGGLSVQYRTCNGCSCNQTGNDVPTLFTYNNATPYVTHDITSDYDMRNAGEGTSRWHKGIDYTNEAGGGNNLHKNLQETKQKSGITNT